MTSEKSHVCSKKYKKNDDFGEVERLSLLILCKCATSPKSKSYLLSLLQTFDFSEVEIVFIIIATNV